MDNKEKKQLIKLFQSFLDVLIPALETLNYPSRKIAHLVDNIRLIKDQLKREVEDGKANQHNRKNT